MRHNKKQAQARILDYLEQGLALSTACALAGVGRRTVYAWMERDKRFAQRVAQARAMPIARAERMLHLLIERGDRQATLWYLERVVPEYRERKEQEDSQSDYALALEVVDPPAVDVDALVEEALSEQ